MGKALSAGMQSSADPEPSRDRVPSRRVPRATVSRAFAEEKLQERRLQPPRLSISIIVLTADTDLQHSQHIVLLRAVRSTPAQAGGFTSSPAQPRLTTAFLPLAGSGSSGRQAVLHGSAGAGTFPT